MDNPGTTRMTLPTKRRTDPTNQFGLKAEPLADRVPGVPDRALLVEVDGVLDTTTRGWADNEFAALLKDSEVQALVLDARGIVWIFSEGLGLIFATLKTLQGRGGAFAVIPSPAVREMMEIFGFTGVIPLAEDPAEAAAFLSNAAADRPPGAPTPDLPREEEDGNGNRAAFEPLPDLTGGLVVRYDGHLDRLGGAWFYGLVLRRVEAGYIRLALDFSGLQQLAPTWLEPLTGILKAVKPRGGRMVYFRIPPKLYEVLELLGISQFFEITDTEAEAVALLKRNSAGLEEPAFPKVFKCPICGARTRAAGPMRGRCKSCKTLLQVTDEGMVFLG